MQVPKKAFRIACRNTGSLCCCYVAQRGYVLDNKAYVGRFAQFGAPVIREYRRNVWGIGFREQPVSRNSPHHPLCAFVVGQRNGP
jgi:hypothetical protein